MGQPRRRVNQEVITATNESQIPKLSQETVTERTKETRLTAEEKGKQKAVVAATTQHEGERISLRIIVNSKGSSDSKRQRNSSASPKTG